MKGWNLAPLLLLVTITKSPTKTLFKAVQLYVKEGIGIWVHSYRTKYPQLALELLNLIL